MAKPALLDLQAEYLITHAAGLAVIWLEADLECHREKGEALLVEHCRKAAHELPDIDHQGGILGLDLLQHGSSSAGDGVGVAVRRVCNAQHHVRVHGRRPLLGLPHHQTAKVLIREPHIMSAP